MSASTRRFPVALTDVIHPHVSFHSVNDKRFSVFVKDFFRLSSDTSLKEKVAFLAFLCVRWHVGVDRRLRPVCLLTFSLSFAENSPERRISNLKLRDSRLIFPCNCWRFLQHSLKPWRRTFCRKYPCPLKARLAAKRQPWLWIEPLTLL